MAGRVEGKVALVTGAARSQGRSHAERLAREGADIVAVDICGPVGRTAEYYPPSTPEDLATTARAIRALDRRVVTAQVDIRDYVALRDAVDDAVRQLGRLDVVVANAGIFQFGPLTHEVSEDSWADMIGVNLTGTWHTCKVGIPHLIKSGGGSIILIGSTAGYSGQLHTAAYTSCKHAMVGLMRTMAHELAPHMIRANVLHPTTVNTPLSHNAALFQLFMPDIPDPSEEQVEHAFRATHALPIPWLEPGDVSNAVLFLASDDSQYITGSELRVDAGYGVKK